MIFVLVSLSEDLSRQSMLRLFIAAIAVCLLSACGLKAPLYLPQPAAQQKQQKQPDQPVRPDQPDQSDQPLNQ